MKIRKRCVHLLFAAVLAVPVTSSIPTSADAQSFQQYCHQRAERLSRYRSGSNVAGGAVRGAIGGAVIGSLLGGRKDRRRGAAAGALIGGIASASRSNSNAARIYRLEYNACMRGR